MPRLPLDSMRSAGKKLHQPLQSYEIRVVNYFFQLRFFHMHDVLAAFRRGANQQDFADKRRPLERYLLSAWLSPSARIWDRSIGICCRTEKCGDNTSRTHLYVRAAHKINPAANGG
jgi:hypothetical protein